MLLYTFPLSSVHKNTNNQKFFLYILTFKFFKIIRFCALWFIGGILIVQYVIGSQTIAMLISFRFTELLCLFRTVHRTHCHRSFLFQAEGLHSDGARPYLLR